MEAFSYASINGAAAAANSRPFSAPRQPNYTCERVQEALYHLALIDPIELCNEAKVEHCRATRDLSSCGRNVQSVLNSCGHASLCEECSQRCDVCPICRIPLPKDGSRVHHRLLYECIEVGLLSGKCDDRLQNDESKRCDDKRQDKEDGEKELIADVQRLFYLFDVALENNLGSLICHYVTDVCMDESAVSSDPVIAFLLDEKVVKDWCKRAYKIMVEGLEEIYKQTIEKLKESLSSLLKFSFKLSGLANVLETLESSFKDSTSAKLHDLYSLQENILKTKQHMDIIIWCTRHDFLENVRSRHSDNESWRSHVKERKSSATKRAWPDLIINNAAEVDGEDNSTLFVEEALKNLDTELVHTDDREEEIQIKKLQENGESLFLRSKLEGLAGLYPFESMRSATDVLFFRGSSDMVVAKQAILLYYLFDRHWTMPEEDWRPVIDDFATTFCISRHSLLESFVFYLLDDHTDEALKEAYRLLPEISGPTVHPKVAQVLLERGNPDAALMVLRWSGQDEARLVSLKEAVTVVRVRVECGLITESFMYQRAVCMKVKENKLSDDSFKKTLSETRSECWTWAQWVEALVTEICCLCARRNLLDRMIELPWNTDEEKHLHNCLLALTIDEEYPSFTMRTKSLLVVFYLQRYRYIEAYEVNRNLISLEQDIFSTCPYSEEILRIRSISHWRSGLVEKSIELLPEVLQQEIKCGKRPEAAAVITGSEGYFPAKSNDAMAIETGPMLTSLLVPSAHTLSDHVMDDLVPSPGYSMLKSTLKVGRSSASPMKEHGNLDASTPRTGFFSETEKGWRPGNGIKRNFNSGNIGSTPRHASSFVTSPVRELNGPSFQKDQRMLLQNGSVKNSLGQSSYPRGAAANSVAPIRTNNGLFTDSLQDSVGKHVPSRKPESPQVFLLNDSMDISWSHAEENTSAQKQNPNGGPRWRSDDSSDDDEYRLPFAAATETSNRRVLRGWRPARR